MPFSIVDDVLHDIPVVRLAGDVDMSVAADLRARLVGLLEAAPPLIVVDLTQVTFFDSAGLKELDDAQRRAGEVGSRLALACPPGRVLRLFEITGLDDTFTIHADAEQATDDGP